MTSKDRELLIQARAVLSDIETNFGCTSYLMRITAAIDAHLSEPQPAEPINQCDGCQRGLPVERGLHRDEQQFPLACTADLYKVEPVKEAPADRKALADEARNLASVLRGMVECGTAPDDLWERDQPDGDPFVARAAELLCLLATTPAQAVPPLGDLQQRLAPVYAALKDRDCLGAVLALEKVLAWCRDATHSHPEQGDAA